MNIEAIDLHKSFGPNSVLRGLNLQLEEGKMACIIGGSGQGKSVLISLLTGLNRPNKGQVLVDGEDITQLNERQLLPVRRRMAVVFQSGALLKSLTVEENVELFLREQRELPRNEIRERVEEALDQFGMADRLKDMPGSLSGGMIKRVAIARALTIRPEIIFYDEPTTGLDPPLAAQVDNMIREVNEKYKVTSMIVTHDMKTVFNLADRVHMLYEGQFIISGSRAELRSSNDPMVRNFLARDIQVASEVDDVTPIKN